MNQELGNVASILRNSIQSLKPISDAPELDAERLLLHVLGKSDSSWLYAHGELPLTQQQQKRFESLISQRATGKPLAYILGSWEFYGREFIITGDVLVPRPETEALVEKALEYISTSILRNIEVKHKPFVIADTCTGSGCIVVSLACELDRNKELGIRNYTFIATDISDKALNIARKNAEKHGVLDTIEFLQGDMLEPLKNQHVDLIVSNPPYVPTKEIVGMHCHCESRFCGTKQSRCTGNIAPKCGLGFEPRIALDGGARGNRYTDYLLAQNIPSIVEVKGGKIQESKKAIAMCKRWLAK